VKTAFAKILKSIRIVNNGRKRRVIMKIVVIGAVAAGTSAAAKARRNSEDAEITVYEKDRFISYSGCGMPYFIGGEVESADELTPRDSAFFKSKYNVDVKILHEVLSIHPKEKCLQIKNLLTGEVFDDSYDKLIIATGASPSIPPIKGTDRENVFVLRNINDMNKIKAFIDKNSPKSAAIIGTGFIGLEVCENLKKLGMEVSLIEKLPQVTPGLDIDMAVYVKDEIRKNGVEVYLDARVEEIGENSVILSDKTAIKADMTLIAAGVRPNTSLAKAAGVELGAFGGIKVNSKMQTNIADIYACGDCIEQFHLVTEKTVYRPLGSTANKTGRIAGDAATGGALEFRGILGTGIFKIFGMTVAQTGLSEREARENGYDVQVCHNIKPNKPDYMGGKEMVIKAVADKRDGRLLGVQIVGYEGVDKRIDVFATAITYKAKAEDLFHLDLAYAPPFSTTKDPVMYTGMILDNAISNGRPLIAPDELDELINSGEPYVLIDARAASQYEKAHIDSARNIPHSALRKAADELDKDVVAVTYCNKGVTGNAAQNILLNKGFKNVFNLSGGHKHYSKLHVKK
jgi:NADPH-dependent 2,4-dienoyl-CoA reductase/sulfur reductase-like enzyme/rhodanese-related sulfurtransferase